MKNIVIGVVAVVIVLVGMLYYFNRSATDSAEVPQASTEAIESPTIVTMEPSTAPVKESVREFSVVASNFKFNLGEIRVKQGEMVRINFKNEVGTHDWRVDEFNAVTKVLQAGQEEIIEFVADKTGEFEYYCSVGNHRQMGMKGMLIVE